MSTGANWLLVEAPPAWAHAAGINEFMHTPELSGAALCHRVRPVPPGSGVAGGKSRKSALLQRLADRTHELLVEVQVVEGIQAAAQDLIATIQVPQVGAGVVRTGVA